MGGVAFPVGDPRLTAPEVFSLGSRVDQVPTITEYQGDVIITNIPGEVGPSYSPNSNSYTWFMDLLLASLTLDIPNLLPVAHDQGVLGGEEGV